MRRLHDSGRRAIWLCLMMPTIVGSVIVVGMVATAGQAPADRLLSERFRPPAARLSIMGRVCPIIMVVLTLLPGSRGDNLFGPDPGDPNPRRGGGSARDPTTPVWTP